ncbi:MAG: phosphatase PAP2 family protein [Candidatus Sulfotelmatobacter sp.]
MTRPSAFRTWLFALILSAAAVGLCIAYVDRPLAAFLEVHVRHTEFWVWLERALRPFALVVIAALVWLFGCGICLISGRPLRPWTETPALYSWAAIWAVASEIILKRIFGRGWPDPTFVDDHLYGFHFLHGMTHWDSFPSGTTTVSFAMLSVFWTLQPRWRAAGVAIAILLLVAVVIGNFHWLSDAIAGAFLGVTVGWSTIRWMHPLKRLTGGN